jgi:hypothetical protein
MATDLLFPFFDIMVNTIFGSVGLSLAALAIVIVIILGLCKTSWVFMLYWMMFYFMVVFTYYIGALGIVIMLLLAGMYFITQMVRIFFPDR